MLSTVDLDLYINKSNDGFGAKEQDQRTCYASTCTSATVLHLAMKHIIGQDGNYPDFYELRCELIAKYGKHEASTKRVLEEVCMSRISSGVQKGRCCWCYDSSISAKGPVVARLYLSGAQ